jgi:hypothetical protein
MATYQANITRNIEPAMADPSAAIQAIKSTGQAVAGAIETVGGTIWDAYKGGQAASLSEDLKQSVSGFQAELDAVKQSDIDAKAALERGKADLPKQVDEFRAGAILSGADPEEAKVQATLFGQKQESDVLARFRAEQQRVTTARDSMPERYKEFMVRSEKILKQYISEMPGMANNFRQIAAEVTGKQNLDLYSVSRLYEDVNFIEKQAEAAAKNAAAMREAQRKAYVEDRKAGGVSETRANQEYNTFDDDTRLRLADLAVATKSAGAAAEQALKTGGSQLQNYVTLTTAKFESRTLEQQGVVYSKLAELGVSKAQIAANTIPDNIRTSPQFQKVIAESQAGILSLLETEYTDANTKLQTAISNGVVDPAMARQARSDLESWYQNSRKYYTTEATAPLLALMSSDDYTKTAQQRLTLVRTIGETLQIPPNVVQELLVSDEKTFSTTVARYPKAVAQLQYLRKLSSAAMRGVPEQEWITLSKEVDTYLQDNVTSVPKTVSQSAAALINFKQVQDKLTNKLLKNEVITQDDVFSMVTSGMSIAANADLFFKAPTTVTNAMSKVPTEEMSALKERTTYQGQLFVYGQNGYGNIAKTEFNNLKSQNPPPNSKGRDIKFVDDRGTSQLRVQTTVLPKDGATAQEQARLKDYIRADIKPTKLNSQLAQVDNVLRIQSQITKEPIEKLRKQFIETFNKEGMVSDSFTASFANAASTAVQTTTTPATQSTTTPNQKVVSQTEIDRMAEQQGVGRDVVIDRAIKSGYTIGE